MEERQVWRCTEIGGQEDLYDNRTSSIVLFGCRTNNLTLNDRKKKIREEKQNATCVEQKM